MYSNWSTVRLLCEPLPANMFAAFQRHYNKYNNIDQKRKRTAPDGPESEHLLLGLVRWLQHIVARPNWVWPWPAPVPAAAAARNTVQALLLLPELAPAVGQVVAELAAAELAAAANLAAVHGAGVAQVAAGAAGAAQVAAAEAGAAGGAVAAVAAEVAAADVAPASPSARTPPARTPAPPRTPTDCNFQPRAAGLLTALPPAPPRQARMVLRGDNVRRHQLFVAATVGTMRRTRAWAGTDSGRALLAAEERAELAVRAKREEMMAQQGMMVQQGCRQVRAPTTMTLGRLQGVTTGRCIEVQWNYVAENGEREMWLCVFGLPSLFVVFVSFFTFVFCLCFCSLVYSLLSLAQPLRDH